MTAPHQFSHNCAHSLTSQWPELICLLWNSCGTCCVRSEKSAMWHIAEGVGCHLNVHTLSQCHSKVHPPPSKWTSQQVTGKHCSVYWATVQPLCNHCAAPDCGGTKQSQYKAKPLTSRVIVVSTECLSTHTTKGVISLLEKVISLYHHQPYI